MKYFGTDGIRGIYGEKITKELAYKVGVAISKTLPQSEIVIGIDTRESSEILANEIARGFNKDIIYAGVVSTPMIAYYSKVNNIIGVMITASHNPYQYNGIKVINNGMKLSRDEELKIEEVIDNTNYIESEEVVLNKSNLVLDLYKDVYKSFEKSKDITFAFDTANGATYDVAPYILNNYGNIKQIGNNPNGLNINLNCGSTYLNHLKDYMNENNVSLGFSFDGDGDRVLVIEDNVIYDGDLIVYVIANYLKKNNELNDNTIVLTKMSNPGLLEALTKNGVKYVLTDVGDKYIQEVLDNKNYSIGGESSGHIILPKYIPTGDGILVAALLLNILKQENKTLKELTKDVSFYPFVLKNLSNMDRSILDKEHIKEKLEEIRLKLPSDSLMLIRKSGTEPLIRVTLSLKDKKLLQYYLNKIIDILREGENK